MDILIYFILFFVFIFCIVSFFGAPYVPSSKKELKSAFTELYPLSEKDVLVDVGSGGGVVLREASKYGAKSIGYEINPILVMVSRLLSRNMKPRSKVIMSSYWNEQFSDDVTVIYAFSVTRDIDKLGSKIQKEANRLNKILYFITYGCKMSKKEPEKNVRAHSLYKFVPTPLHTNNT